MCVCLVEQSEIGGAGGGLTGEQVDGGLTHTPDRTPGFTFPVLSHRKSSDEKTSCWSSRGHNLFLPKDPRPLWAGWGVHWMLPPDGWTSTSEPSLTVGRRGSINNDRDYSLFRIVRCNRCGGRSGPQEHSSFCSIQVQCRYNSNSILIGSSSGVSRTFLMSF